MTKLNKLSYVAIGTFLTLIVGTITPAFAANEDVVKQLSATFMSNGKPISIYFNNTKVTTKDSNGNDVSPFVVDGTTYLPVRAIATALGKEVTWDGMTASVNINDIKIKLKVPDATKNNDNAKFTTSVDDKDKRHDKLNYKFTLDKEAVGEWKIWDAYENLDEFDPSNASGLNFGWEGISIYEDGTMTKHMLKGNMINIVSGYSWTKGYLTTLWSHFGLKDVIPAYEIQNINGKMYMIVELKNNDYITKGMIYYFVLEKVSDTASATSGIRIADKQLTASFTSNGNPISININGIKVTSKDGNVVSPIIVEGTTYLPVRAIAEALGKEVAWDDATAAVKIINIIKVPSEIYAPKDSNAKLTTIRNDKGEFLDRFDYTFTLDEGAVGKWKSSGHYQHLSDFDPTNPPSKEQWLPDMSIYEDGTIVNHITQKNDSNLKNVGGYSWTKGYLIISGSTEYGIPAYTLQNINGKTYMFMEWKSMDYVVGGKISYYVFEKVSDTPAERSTK